MRALVLGCIACLAGCGRMNFQPRVAAGTGDGGGASGDGGGGGGGGGGGMVDAMPGSDGSSVAPDAMPGADAMLPPDAASACLTPDPASATTFPAGAPCNGWGTLTQVSATVVQSGAGLQVSPNANSLGAQGRCDRATVMYGAAGMLLHVGQAVAGTGAVTGFQAGTGGNALELVVNGSNIEAQDGSGTLATAPYNAAMMKWLWIHPNASNTGSVFETSPDGLTWSQLATSSETPQASYSVIVIAATLSGGDATPGTAQFLSFDVCPP